ncbi:MAG: glycosyltransferase family 4 protein [Actinomycetota bacterium]|nr:glycosyltransferase family 4 protein [Actinomycetota bacterium]
MRIAEVAPPWLAVPPKGYGGIEWVVASLSDGLAERGHDVTLFATGDSDPKARLEYVFEMAPGPAAINSVWHDSLHQLLVHRDPGRFDLIHQHTPWSGLVAARLLDVPVVHTLHGEFNDDMRALYAEVAGDVWFVAVSEDQRSHMPDLRYAGVVHNGIEVGRYPLRERKDEFLLFLGRGSPDKGPARAIAAAREAGRPLVMALKVAHPEEVRHWKEDLEPALGDDVEVRWELSLDEKTDLLSRARAVLFPIDWDEPLGLVMTEAMACGTPVVATPRGAAPEVVVHGETGFVVPVEAYAEAAAEALERVDDIDPRACRRRVEERFSAETMVRGYEAAFERALAGA